MLFRSWIAIGQAGFYNSWDEESSELLIACDNEFQQILKALPVRIEPIPTLLEYYDSYDASIHLARYSCEEDECSLMPNVFAISL